jgi:hypothetical protein
MALSDRKLGQTGVNLDPWLGFCCYLDEGSNRAIAGGRRAQSRSHKLKNASLLVLIAMTSVFAGHAQAIYKCTTSRGVIYQDRPCKEGAETDVAIVIPTGEIAPKALPAPDDRIQGNPPSPDSRIEKSKPGRSGENPVTATRPADSRAAVDATANAADDSQKKDARTNVNNSAPMTAEQARKADPTAKYYTTDGAAPGAETPGRMTCESPTGEKRLFILTNGQLTSI